VNFLFPVWDRWNHNKYLVQMINPVIAISYNKLWWPSGKDTWLSHRRSRFKSRRDLFEEKFFLCLCFTKNLIPKSRNLYLSTPMDDFSRLVGSFPAIFSWLYFKLKSTIAHPGFEPGTFSSTCKCYTTELTKQVTICNYFYLFIDVCL